MAYQQWDPTSLPERPGLYTNFNDAAVAQIRGGARGTVAIPLNEYSDGTALPGKFYTIEDEGEAVALFGIANITSIVLALGAGAKEVLVYTMPEEAEAADFIAMRDAFEARPFNVFVYDGEISSTERDLTKAWVTRNRAEKKHFTFVTGGTAVEDLDPATGNLRSTALKDDYIVNLIDGGDRNGVNYSSGQYASYIAGLIAGTPINKSITYTQVPLDDVNKRLRNNEIVTALKAGSLVLVNDGELVKIEQGVATSGAKIRKVRARQAIATDIEKTARDSYIGKLDNDEDGQAALISAIKVYLETLENSNVLTDIVVILDPYNKSVGDAVFLLISFTEIDSMERIFLSINV